MDINHLIKHNSLGLVVMLMLCFSLPGMGQSVLRMEILAQGEPLPLEQKMYFSKRGDSISVENLLFYISDFSVWKGEDKIASGLKKYWLINAAEPASMALALDGEITQGDKVSFSIGVDSTISVAGPQEGDLDPVRGMYWTWQSGYINFKLEGTSSNCPARGNRFQFHIGGYQYPSNSLHRIELPLEQGLAGRRSGEIILQLEIGALLKQIDLRKQYEIMRPGEEAIAFTQFFDQIFSLGR